MKKSPVGIGIVGTGFARTTQIPGFQDCMGAKVVAIASRSHERGEAIAKARDLRRAGKPRPDNSDSNG